MLAAQCNSSHMYSHTVSLFVPLIRFYQLIWFSVLQSNCKKYDM